MNEPIEFMGDSFTATAELYEHGNTSSDYGSDYVDIKLIIVHHDETSRIELDCMTHEIDGMIELLEKIKVEQTKAYERLEREETIEVSDELLDDILSQSHP